MTETKPIHPKTMILWRIMAVIAFILPLSLSAQTYHSLWQQADKALEQDRPQTALATLRKIEIKAAGEKQYGHLMASLFMQLQRAGEISADSIPPVVQKMLASGRDVWANDRVASVMFHVAMRQAEKMCGLKIDSTDLYKDYIGFGHEEANKSLVAELLADSKLRSQLTRTEGIDTYLPLLKKEKGGEYFSHDIISVIASALGDYQSLVGHYLSVGDRKAACLMSARMIEGMEATCRDRKSLEAKADSLILIFSDLQECGALAIQKYRLLDKPKEKVEWIDRALQQWGSWAEMNYLRNERQWLILPQISIVVPSRQLRSGLTTVLPLRRIRNISHLQLDVTTVKGCPQKTMEKALSERNLLILKPFLAKKPLARMEKTFEKHPEYELFSDSISIDRLPYGTYLVTATCDGKRMEDADFLVFVSDLKVISLPLSTEKTRYVVVNATTGKPVPGAKLHLWDREKGRETVCHTNAKGEYVGDRQAYGCLVSASYGEDDALAYASLWNNFMIKNEAADVTDCERLFTDRGIYRPGQTVRVSILSYRLTKGTETTVNADRKVRLRLFDANYNNIGETQVVTDEYGVASAEFTLPEKGLNGRYSVMGERMRTFFQVEEYVRPTFEVSISRPETDYANGDTVTVAGKVMTYGGVPVAGARVAYSVKRQESWWRAGRTLHSEQLLVDTVWADASGKFEIRMPMLLPEGAHQVLNTGNENRIFPPMFYDIVAEATVTDIAGETHSASLSLPVSNRKSILTSNIKEKMLRDTANVVTFTRRNQAGTEIKGTVMVSIDGEKPLAIDTGKPFALPDNLASGKHTLVAVCEEDTLERTFVLFSMTDKRPVVDTPNWYYQSAETFSVRKGEPVYVQFGTAKRDTYAYYSLYHDGEIVESGAVRLDSSIVTRQFEYKEEYGDFINFAIAWVRDGELYAHSAVIRRPLPDKHLSLKWTTFRNRLSPGQKETWTLSVTDSRGKPAGANLIATLYDKSLDAVKPFSWNFNDPRYLRTTIQNWVCNRFFQETFYADAGYNPLDNRFLTFDDFDNKYFDCGFYNYIEYDGKVNGGANIGFVRGKGTRVMRTMASKEMTVMAAAPMPAMDMEEKSSPASSDSSAETSSFSETTRIRESLGETAFFLSDIKSGADGIATLSFTLPESVTTWRFLAFANDKDLRFGMMEDEVVAQKQLMIQPRMPRFLREGDCCSIPATVSNLTENALDVKVIMTVLDAETEKTVATFHDNIKVKAGEMSAVSFSIDSKGLEGRTLIVRCVADAGTFNDGEQHYLPVLSAKEQIIETRTVVLSERGTAEVDAAQMLPDNVRKGKMTVEYTDAPEWLMVQALPQIADPSEDNAISLVTAYYANSLASHIAQSNPDIMKVVEKWTKDVSSLESPLMKNEELHHTILAETPWMMPADDETTTRKQLFRLFDRSLLASRKAFALKHLTDLQLPEGAFAWWKGMQGSRYMTVAVTETLLRIDAMTGKSDDYRAVLSKAFAYLDKEIAKDVKRMKETKRKKKVPYLSHFNLRYLYCRALYDGKMPASVRADVDYMLDYLAANTRKGDIQTKADAAVILSRFGKKALADEFLQSVLEHTVFREDMGRYFDSYRAAYSWADYRIPTQVSVIEALKAVRPEQRQYVTEMQRWLLQSKRTQAWDTPLNAVNAIYAFLSHDKTLRHGMKADIKLGTETLKPQTDTYALGYAKATREITRHPDLDTTLKIDKQSDGESWANIYMQYVVPSVEARNLANGISIQRELSSGALKVGDKVTVTITVIADRDYDFVTITDRRPACLEPTTQISGYRNGCYQVMRDSQSQYHFNALSKGKHVITTDYYVSRQGDFTSGTATAQCAYAPEFAGSARGIKVAVR